MKYTHHAASDLAFSRVQKGLMFTKWANNNGSAGNFTMIQLWNPANSNVIAQIYAIRAVIYAASVSFQLYSYAAALTTLTTTGYSTHLGYGSSGSAVYTDQQAAKLGTQLDSIASAGQWNQELTEPWEFALEPGNGLIVTVGAAGATQMSASFVWTETH